MPSRNAVLQIHKDVKSKFSSPRQKNVIVLLFFFVNQICIKVMKAGFYF